MDGVLAREHPKRHSGADEGDGTDVALLHLVGLEGLFDGRNDLTLGVGNLDLDDLCGIEKPVDVLLKPEDRGSAAGLLVGAYALEDAHSVMKGVGHHVHLGLLPRHQSAIEPDKLGFGRHKFLFPDIARSQGARA
jgi:hypothetical protein